MVDVERVCVLTVYLCESIHDQIWIRRLEYLEIQLLDLSTQSNVNRGASQKKSMGASQIKVVAQVKYQ